MRIIPIINYLFEKNRQKLTRRLPSHSLAIITSNDIMPRSADQYFPFHQNADLFYLSGIEQPNTTLILFPDHHENIFREILFIEKTTEYDKTWLGEKHTKEQARELSGIKTIYWLDEFEAILCKLMQQARCIFIQLHEDERKFDEVTTRDFRLAKKIKELYPLHQFERLAPIIDDLRQIKEPEEIEQIRNAIKISNSAFSKLLSKIKPNVTEFEVEAEIIAEFIRNGANGHAFDPIVASGGNSCILHYKRNSSSCESGDLLLIDFGAEYNHYNADITRVLPINGKFNARQRKVYDAVLRLHHKASSMLKPGISLETVNQELIFYIEKELVELELLDYEKIKAQDPEKPLYKKYFLHGVSHFLGLDVHDSGKKTDIMQKGMVVTCEPGIYIHEEKLGIRLENNFLITENGAENLSYEIPIDPDEIEKMMANR
jgi:Xaa-Pro aminopeptidase